MLSIAALKRTGTSVERSEILRQDTNLNHPLIINHNGKVVQQLSQRMYFTKEHIRKAFERGFNFAKGMHFNIIVK